MLRTSILGRALFRSSPSLIRYSYLPVNRSKKVTSLRFNSNETKKPEKEKPILTDDLLAKAGFDEPEKAEKDESSGKEEQTEESQQEGDEKKGSRRRRTNQTSKDIQREKYANFFYLTAFAGVAVGAGYLCRDWDSEEERNKLDGKDVDNGYSPGLMYGRFSKRMGSIFTFFSEPVFEKLLPPPAPEAYRRPLTLVLTLDDLLIHSLWDRKNGWRTGKRPGLDYFLGYLSQYYEIVIFLSNYQVFSEQVVQKLDPFHAYISYALFREACRYKDSKLIKDLSLLNRDLEKVILVDVDPASWTFQPDNAVPMKPWDGKPDDTLIRLIPLLEYLATHNVKDVRTVLNSFNDKYNIIDEYTQREQILREKWKQENAHLFRQAGKPNAGSVMASFLGLPSSTMNKEPKMPLDAIREHGQYQYQRFQKYLQENAPKIMEEEKLLQEKFGKFSLSKLVTEGTPTPEDVVQFQAERAKTEQAQASAQK